MADDHMARIRLSLINHMRQAGMTEDQILELCMEIDAVTPPYPVQLTITAPDGTAVFPSGKTYPVKLISHGWAKPEDD